jgi:hypothetical protein
MVLRTEQLTLEGLGKILEIENPKILSLTPRVLDRCHKFCLDMQRKKKIKTRKFGLHNELVENSPGYRALDAVSGGRRREEEGGRRREEEGGKEGGGRREEEVKGGRRSEEEGGKGGYGTEKGGFFEFFILW